MKIKKYRPNFFEGFEDVFYEVSTKEELLKCELCKHAVDNGYEICLSKTDCYGGIMAVKENKNNEDGAEWWVLAIIYDTQDVATLSEWLPDWNLKREEYKNKMRQRK